MRPDDSRPEPVIPHLEPLGAPGAAQGMEPGDLVEDKEEEKEVAEGTEEETSRGKVKPGPEEPSEQERETHDMTHLPY